MAQGTHVDMRDIIGQAENLIRQRFGIDAPAAYSLLVRLSYQQNRSLVAIAGELVAERRAQSVPTLASQRGSAEEGR